MRRTLIEVLGEARGAEMYSMEWLVNRVLQHCGGGDLVGHVYLAQTTDNRHVGYTIVRIDADGNGEPIGLFSTTYVDPNARNLGVASALLEQGERWMVDHQMTVAVTYTDEDNTKLKNCFLRRGYQLSPMPDDFVRLAKDLSR